MELTPCNSSFITGHHYDADKRELTVEIKGKRYAHADVPMEKAEAFSGAASPGAYYGKKIKGLHASRSV